MELDERVVIVTGGAQGIGLALCERFARAGARVVVADLDEQRARAVAARLDGMGMACDVGVEAQLRALVDAVLARYGKVDLFCSNAGVLIPDGGPLPCDGDERSWELSWRINVMAHVHAARAVLPHMLERGEGYLLQMVSAAGLMNQLGSASYTATKHAALAFAESLAIGLGGRGIKVSAICPAYVATAMVGLGGDQAQAGILSAEQVADSVLEGIREERFLIFPHREVADYVLRKAQDQEAWLAGMRKLHGHVIGSDGHIDWSALFSATAPRGAR